MVYAAFGSLKRVHPQVHQRNVPGIDNAYLAMDTEEGVEVVWNEVMFSERKNFKLQEVRHPARTWACHLSLWRLEAL